MLSNVSRQSPDLPDLVTGSSGRDRTRRLVEGTSAALVSKGVVLAVSAVSIPITVRYLGAENFGVWVTISTTLSMLLVLDLGVATSLMNFVSEAYARSDQEHASTYSTTALVTMVVFALFLAGVAWLIWPMLHWDRLFGLSSATEVPMVSHAMAAAFIVFLVGLPAGLAPKILSGYQEVRTANMFIAGGALCNLASIILVVRMHGGLVALVAASAASLVLANLVCLVWLWTVHKPWLRPRVRHVKAKAGRRMMQSGSEFFMLQISALLAFNSDNLIVAHYLGPVQVAPYSVAWRLVGYATIAQVLLTPSLWPAFSEAFTRGDFEWIRKTFRQTMWVTMSLAISFSVVLAVFGRWVIRIWASRAAVPSESVMLLMCIWIVISAFMTNTAIVLAATGETRLQAWCSLASALVNVALSIYWVQRIGAAGVILGTIVSFILILVGPQTWKVHQVLPKAAVAGRGSDVPQC